MTWINFDEAVGKVLEYKGYKGCHVFYSGEYDKFEVQETSKNAKTINEKIEMRPHRYCGFYKPGVVLCELVEDFQYVKTLSL